LAAFIELLLPPAPELGDGALVEIDGPAAGHCLGLGHGRPAVDKHPGVAHGQACRGKIDVDPPQTHTSPRRIPVEAASSQAA